MNTFETPSRIWRRIEEGEARNGEMPSLPSFPHFEDDDSNVSGESSIDFGRSRSRSLRKDKSDILVNDTKTTHRSRTPSLSRTISSVGSSTNDPTPQGSVSIGVAHVSGRIPSPSPEISFRDTESVSVHEELPEPDFDLESISLNNSNHMQDLSEPDALTKSFRNSKRSHQSSIPSPRSRSVDMVDMSLDEDGEPNLAPSEEAPSSISYPSISDPSMVTKATPSPLPAIREETIGVRHTAASAQLATPQPQGRRKSFLLDVINSTARPRLSFTGLNGRGPPTNTYHDSPNATPGPSTYRPLPGLRAELARRRTSHPLAQVQTFDPSTPAANSTPSGASHTPPGSNASIVSTASSHDLTAYPRANASFDPATGAKGVGRFNAGKLNTYLHGLNRRLQEENEALLEQLRVHEEEIARLSARGGGTGELSGVAEDVGAEGWPQEREAMERQLDELTNDIQNAHSERDSLTRELEETKVERARDKERWKERMNEVEEGVGGIIKGLEKRLEESERKASMVDDAQHRAQKAEEELRRVQFEHGLLEERARKAELLMATEKDLGTELNAANEEITQLRVELETVETRLEEALHASEGWKRRADTTDSKLATEKERSTGLQTDLQTTKQALESSKSEVRSLDQQCMSLDEELQKQQVSLQELEITAELAADRIEELEQLLRAAEERADAATLASPPHKSVSLSESRASKSLNVGLDTRADVEALEDELAQAHKEIGRLNALLGQSRQRKALEDAKDMKIDSLELEKQRLQERIRALQAMPDVVSTPNKAGPNRAAGTNAGAFSPLHKQLMSMYLKTPKTPGGVSHLRDMSWLSSMTPAASTTPLVAEVNRLQRRLDEANDDIDDKLNQLEEAGFDIFGMSKDLHDAHLESEKLKKDLETASERITELEKALRSEQSRLRSVSNEQSRSSEKQSELLLQVQKAESTTKNLKVRLQELERKNSELERAVLDNTSTRETVQKLETLLAENKETISKLRDDRSRIANERIDLQRRLHKAEEHADDIRKRYDDSHLSHEKRQHKLDKYANEVQDLRKTLGTQVNTHRAVLKEKNRDDTVAAEFKRTVATLEGKLLAMRKEVETYGRDLKALHAEKSKAEKSHCNELAQQEMFLKQEQERSKSLKTQLQEQLEETRRAADELKRHVCVVSNNDEYTKGLMEQHNHECKGLMLQIRYLKAKYTRESSLRADLGYQKKYLLILLSRYQNSEKKVLATIVQVGFPAPAATRRKSKSLKTVALLTIFISRIKRANETWQSTRSYKELLADAHEDVRRRRVQVA